MGPFPTGTRQMKFLVVGIDYFTKWVEAEPLAKIRQQNVKNFVWKSIVCRFGVSNIPRQPSEYLTPMMAPWPFAQWRLDILGPFPTRTRQMKFLVVGIDYFTK